MAKNTKAKTQAATKVAPVKNERSSKTLQRGVNTLLGALTPKKDSTPNRKGSLEKELPSDVSKCPYSSEELKDIAESLAGALSGIANYTIKRRQWELSHQGDEILESLQNSAKVANAFLKET